MANVLVDGGRRQGRTLANESGFRTVLARGDAVFTKLNGLYFAVTLNGDRIAYEALTETPPDLVEP